MTSAERIAETVARRTDRKGFLKRSAVFMFTFVSAASVSGLRAGFATAATNGPCPDSSKGCNCSPIYTNSSRRYCTSYNTSYCNGSKCSGICRYNQEAWSTGCWCTASCCHNGRWAFYRCCDCYCVPGGNANSYTCGCRALHLQCGSGTTAASASMSSPASDALLENGGLPVIGEQDPFDVLPSAVLGPACC